MSGSALSAQRHTASVGWILTAATMLAVIPASAQTPELAVEAARVLETLESRGVTDQETFFAAFQNAWDADRAEEYDALRALGISASDAVFDGSWQNQPTRPSLFDPYDVQMWTYDVIRSWGKVVFLGRHSCGRTRHSMRSDTTSASGNSSAALRRTGHVQVRSRVPRRNARS
jgi:hypothetical protein